MPPSTIENHLCYLLHDHVKKFCLPLEKNGILGFFYIRLFSDGSFIDLSNQLEWTRFFLDKYLSGQYSLTDVKNHMMMNNEKRLWSFDKENIIWQEGLEHYDFGNGISICQQCEDYREIVAFYSGGDNEKINQFYINHLEYLMRFIHFFKQTFEEDLNKGYRRKNFLYTPQQYLNDNEQLSASLPCLSFSTDLSKRELVCVKLRAKGKTMKEIGKMLFISPRTVETHLHNSMRKLHCKNSVELISMAKNLYNL